jgi:hypothetical protein
MDGSQDIVSSSHDGSDLSALELFDHSLCGRLQLVLHDHEPQELQPIFNLISLDVARPISIQIQWLLGQC